MAARGFSPLRMVTMATPSLVATLERHHAGDPGALEELVAELLPWLHGYVQRKMGPKLRTAEASLDVVQEVLLRVLQKGAAFVPATEDQLLRLVATMAMNRLRDRHDWLAVRVEASQGITRLGDSSTPSTGAARQEQQDFLELGIQLLDPEDALILHERNWEELDFAEIGRRREITADAARMRFNAAVRRLGKLVRQLQAGELNELAPDLPPLDTVP